MAGCEGRVRVGGGGGSETAIWYLFNNLSRCFQYWLSVSMRKKEKNPRRGECGRTLELRPQSLQNISDQPNGPDWKWLMMTESATKMGEKNWKPLTAQKLPDLKKNCHCDKNDKV